MTTLLLLVRLAALTLAALTATGCVTRGYKLAAKDTPPPVPLNFSSVPVRAADDAGPGATAANVAPEAIVHTVIVYQGPGSWKREAYWDEYVVSVVNRHAEPLILTTAVLHSNMAETVEPGDNPWKLERIGKQWWETNAARQAGTYLLLGTGAVASLGVATVAAFSGGLFAPLTGGAAMAVGAGAAVAVALPVVALGSVGMNLHRKHQIQDEFARRRLVLPLTLAPGEKAQGSLFFRITPSPRELVLKTARGTQAADVAVNLSPLSGLHLRLPVTPTKPAK